MVKVIRRNDSPQEVIPPKRDKITIKQAMAASFECKGGVEYLNRLADTHPQVYASMLSKLIPTEISAKVEQDITVIVNVDGRSRVDD